jgi:hypothetical protein
MKKNEITKFILEKMRYTMSEEKKFVMKKEKGEKEKMVMMVVGMEQED